MTNKSPKEYRYWTIGDMVIMDAMTSQQGHLDKQESKKPKLKNVTPIDHWLNDGREEPNDR